MSEIILLIIGFLVFVSLREFWCWYWKINERRDLLKDISEKLDKNTKVSSGNEWQCSNCNTMNPKELSKCFECNQSK